MVDWSWDLLGEDERRLWRRFALFHGGADVTVVERVCDADVDVLAALVDKSLLVLGPQGRYRMPETIREYGLERLAESGESESQWLVLGRYLLGPATEAEPHVRGRDQLFWLDRLAQEHDNLHASLRAAIDAGDAATACALVARLGWYWWLRGHRMEGAALASEVSLIKPLVGIFEQPDAEAGFRAVEPLFDDPDPWLRATSRMILAHLRLNFGQSSEAASADMREALAGFRAIGERWGIGFSLSALGDMAAAEGDFAQAVRSQYEALALVREVGIRENIPQLEVKLAHQLWMAGELAEARRMLKQSRQSAEEIGLPEVIASVRHGFATFARLEGNLVEARAAATVAATQLEKPTFAPQFRATTRGTLGLIEASAGNLVAARATPYGVRETARSPTATGS